ncbi:hypothetical protein KR51_00006530 [Rubidibacter lacunae KORDI 51-2]|uniref:Uncharacterized protein n=2 Tax=Rubidibacter TaxID=582491 RepID=U5DLU5_9CHRO|nr:hypothetical protein KR51_00006530 [Rubidibacter lacunae KORDI 51-2]
MISLFMLLEILVPTHGSFIDLASFPCTVEVRCAKLPSEKVNYPRTIQPEYQESETFLQEISSGSAIALARGDRIPILRGEFLAAISDPVAISLLGLALLIISVVLFVYLGFQSRWVLSTKTIDLKNENGFLSFDRNYIYFLEGNIHYRLGFKIFIFSTILGQQINISSKEKVLSSVILGAIRDLIEDTNYSENREKSDRDFSSFTNDIRVRIEREDKISKVLRLAGIKFVGLTLRRVKKTPSILFIDKKFYGESAFYSLDHQPVNSKVSFWLKFSDEDRLVSVPYGEKSPNKESDIVEIATRLIYSRLYSEVKQEFHKHWKQHKLHYLWSRPKQKNNTEILNPFRNQIREN